MQVLQPSLRGARLQPHRDAVQQDSSHADEGAILHCARMNGGSVT